VAYVRAHETTAKRKGKPVKRYEVIWREPATDANGFPNGKTRARQESYPARDAAEARRDELNNAKHKIGGTSALADQKKAGALTFGHYASGWLAAQQVKVATGAMKQGTFEKYTQTLAHDVHPRFGGKAIASITVMDCEMFRADLAGRLRRATVNNVWRVLRHVLRYAQRHNAILANPADAVELGSVHAVGAQDSARHALTATQVAAVAAKLRETSPVYELVVLFMAYTGLRQAETQGLEVRDLTLRTGPNGNMRGSVRVQRTKTRRHAQWHIGTPKSKTSRRTVPLPPWLATRMDAYLSDTHERADEPEAPLWPRRLPGGARYKGDRAEVRFDWSEPCDLNGLQSKVIRPALEAAGLPASRPARVSDDGTTEPAIRGVRLHDWRHTFAALQLSAGTHFMQVSKWMGHASYVITMTVYADWIPEEDTGNTLPEPVAPTTAPAAKVVNLFG
jgi:integrase